MNTYVVTKPFADPRMQQKAEWTANMLNGSFKTSLLIGCSPSAIVAQAAHETGWGESAIGNNVFGIKADRSWKGAVLERPTWEVINGKVVHIVAAFRDYPTLADGIEDHFKFLRDNKRYADVFDPDGTMSDHEYFRRLQADGYATDPNYADRLVAVQDTVHRFMQNMSTDGQPPAPPPPRLLMIGSKGSDVAALQRALGTFYPYIADSDFGPKTKAAVIEFQKRHPECGEADGIVGALTRAALKL